MEHSHAHGVIDPSIITHERGLWAVKWSFVVLTATAFLQLVIVVASNSVALLADTIHNFGDAATAIPLGIAFLFAGRKPSKRFTYGYGRIEDLAGVLIVLLILFSAVVAAYESFHRFFHPKPVHHLAAVVAASVLSFLGNEGVALFRIKVGKEIGSAALVADGYHARIDGWASLAVFVGAAGVWLGFPLADPVAGLIITISILFIVWSSGKEIFSRMLDGVDPEILREVEHAAGHVEGAKSIGDIRARWVGHKLFVEMAIAVRGDASAKEGHDAAEEVRHEILHHLPHVGQVMVRVEPER
ncbi:MAG: cation transporter [Candidatus Omnitrophica bacterium]|nr:cation transporter [Candidatus Omnitrophota bacterium]